jgi:hypothetical protein
MVLMSDYSALTTTWISYLSCNTIVPGVLCKTRSHIGSVIFQVRCTPVARHNNVWSDVAQLCCNALGQLRAALWLHQQQQQQRRRRHHQPQQLQQTKRKELSRLEAVYSSGWLVWSKRSSGHIEHLHYRMVRHLPVLSSCQSAFHPSPAANTALLPVSRQPRVCHRQCS